MSKRKATGILTFRLATAVAALAAALSLAAVSSVLAGTVTYTYDDAGRLIGADYGGDRTITYHYDANGNLTRRETAAEDGIFADGFESGDAGAWSASTGGGATGGGAAATAPPAVKTAKNQLDEEN